MFHKLISLKKLLPILIIFYSNFYSTSILSMKLTPEETACWDWSEQHQSLKSLAYKSLSPEDQATIQQKVKYSEHPEKVASCIKNLATNFYNLAQQEKFQTPYDIDFLSKTFLKVVISMQSEPEKPKDLLSARIYVFKKLLTLEEQKQMSLKDSFLKNPKVSQKVIEKWANLLIEELTKLGMVPNTEEDKSKTAKKFALEKMEELKKSYS